MNRPIRADDLYDLSAVGQVALVPGGAQVVFTITWPDRETDEPRSQLHLHDGDQHRLLTPGHRDTSPRIAPSGDRVLFLRSEPEGKPQPAILDLSTAEVTEITGFEDDGVDWADWLDDHRIVVRATRRPLGEEGIDSDELGRRPRVIRSVDYRFNGRGWVHDRKRSVEVVDLNSGTIAAITDNSYDHQAVAAAPDGSSVLVASPTDNDADLTGANRVWKVPTNGADPTLLTPAAGRWGDVGFLSDGRPFAIGALDLAVVSLARPHLLDITGANQPVVIGPHDVNCSAAIGGGAGWVAREGQLFTPGIRGTTVSVDRYDPETDEITTVASGPFVVQSFDTLTQSGRLVAAVSTPMRPAELWEFTAEGSRVLCSLNDDLLEKLDLVDPELVRVRSTDDVDVEAFVVRPPASVSAGLGPGLVYVHGGPMSIYSHAFFDEFQIAAADGYTVIAGNPRGSDGYGESWARAITGHLGQKDWDDVQALTDHLSGLPEVDSDRIGIGGGSYGGFMASWAISKTNRYRAALVERAVTNWESFAGTSDIGSYFLPVLLGATCEDDIESLRRQSPLTYAANVQTPTLILHSEEDWRCPIEQAEQLFAAYRRGGVDVTFARFPGENHELSRSGSPRHRVERFELIHEFFDSHLKDGPE